MAIFNFQSKAYINKKTLRIKVNTYELCHRMVKYLVHKLQILSNAYKPSFIKVHNKNFMYICIKKNFFNARLAIIFIFLTL